MEMFRCLFCLCLCVTIVYSSELCGLEPPKQGEDCGGSLNVKRKKEEDLDAKWERELYQKASYTSEAEWPFREQLDNADDLIIHDQEEAIRQFDGILKEVKSHRAIYARARAKEIQHMENDSSQLLDEIIEDFMEVVKDEKAMGSIWTSAFYHLRVIYENRIEKFYEKDTQLLEYILTERTEDAFSKISIDHIMSSTLEMLYAQGNFDGGARAYERALNLTREDHGATFNYVEFLYGITLRQIPSRKKEGNKILRGLNMDTTTHTLPTIIEIFSDKCRKLGLGQDKIDNIMKEASKLHIIVSSDQKAAEFLDNVKNKAVWDMEVDKEITVYEEEILLLKENWTLMREEALVLMKNVSIENGWLSFPKTYNISGNWSEYPLFTYGAKRHHHCGSAPETCKILKSFPASSKFKRGTVKFIAIQPETKLFGFHGPTNAVLRAHLGLQMPSDGAEKAVLQVGKHHQLQLNEGHTVIFDNSFDRTYINHSSKEPILLLSFDIPNPDLSQDMKQMSYTLGARPFFVF